jgi:hypothetical protein
LTRRWSGVAALLALPLMACGSGTDEARFTPQSFVAAANEHGAELVLGDALPYQRSNAELWTVTFAEHAHEEAGAAEGGHSHESGTLAVFPDEAVALAEYENCRAGGLQCYRADNISLTFLNTVHPADLTRLSGAFESLAAQ